MQIEETKFLILGDTFLVKVNGVRSWKKDVNAIYLCLGQ